MSKESTQRRSWRNANPVGPETSDPQALHEHIDRARQLGVPESFQGDHLISKAVMGYLDKLGVVTKDVAEEYGFESPGELIAAQLHCELQVDMHEFDADVVRRVSLGVNIARANITRTLV